MARSMGNVVVYLAGVAIVIAAIWVLYTQTGLADVVPLGLVAAVMLLVLGIAVIAVSDRIGRNGRLVRETTTAGPRSSTTTTREVRERDAFDDERDRRL